MTGQADIVPQVRLSVVGKHRRQLPEWPTFWPVPKVGDEVSLPNGATVHVRHVVWVLSGTPYAYVVLGERKLDNG